MREAGTAKFSLNGSATYSQFKLLLILTFFPEENGHYSKLWSVFAIATSMQSLTTERTEVFERVL